MHSGDNKRAHVVLLDLFNNVEPTPDQTRLIAKAANHAGDFADSYSYMAEFYFMTGDLQRWRRPTTAGVDAAWHSTRCSARACSARLEEVRAAMPKNHNNTVADGNGNGSGRN